MTNLGNSIQILKNIVDNVEVVITGKRESVELTLISLICNGHVLIEDVPGVGKTSLVSALAKSITASFKRIQFNPDLLPSDVTGFSMYNPKTCEFEYRAGSIMCNIVLADEINRSSPRTQSCLLEVMEEYQVTVDGVTYEVPKPFMVLATQNPIESYGTYPLPEAQLDRFFMKVTLGYPSPVQEKMIVQKFKTSNPMESLKAVAGTDEILAIQKEVKHIHVDDGLMEYIVSIINETRNHPDIALGSSPRGSMYLSRAAQAWALYNNRNYIIPEDITKMLIPVLSHRLMLKQEAKLKKITTSDVLLSIVKKLKVPVVDYNVAK